MMHQDHSNYDKVFFLGLTYSSIRRLIPTFRVIILYILGVSFLAVSLLMIIHLFNANPTDVAVQIGYIQLISDKLSDRSKVTQNKINFVKKCPQWGLNP